MFNHNKQSAETRIQPPPERLEPPCPQPQRDRTGEKPAECRRRAGEQHQPAHPDDAVGRQDAAGWVIGDGGHGLFVSRGHQSQRARHQRLLALGEIAAVLAARGGRVFGGEIGKAALTLIVEP